MTRVRLSLKSNGLLRMHRITRELLPGMVCTPGMAGTASHARAMTRRYHTVFTPRLHRHTPGQSWWGFRAYHMQRHQERDQCVGTRTQGLASAFARAAWSASQNGAASTPQVGG